VDLPVATEWFAVDDQGDDIARLTEPHVRALIRSNVYVVTSNGQALIIDTGCGIVPLRPYLPPMRTPPAAVATHGHFDHVGGLHEFAARMIHKAEAADLAEPDPMATLMPSRYPPLRELFGPKAPEHLLKAQPTPGYDPERYLRRPARPTHVLTGGDHIDVGDRRLDVVHLPGHSPGSICLYEHETATLFSGDVIYDDVLVDDGLPGTSRSQYIESMKQVLAMELRRVLPGHGDPLRGDDAHRIAAQYLRGMAGA
jgi:glyoxylase-like metal-dependent hydrolase (beta-lactamase superfamily II)